MIQPGQRDRRAHFRRRTPGANPRELGGYTATVARAWVGYRAASGRAQIQAGQDVAFETAVLTVPATPATRAITVGHRVLVDGIDHRITSVTAPGRTGSFEVAITTDLDGKPLA